VQKVDELLHQGYTDIVDADLSKYFDRCCGRASLG